GSVRLWLPQRAETLLSPSPLASRSAPGSSCASTCTAIEAPVGAITQQVTSVVGGRGALGIPRLPYASTAATRTKYGPVGGIAIWALVASTVVSCEVTKVAKESFCTT